MNIYFAPLEGVTDATYRRVHRESFGGVSRYFIPFISPTQNMRFTPRELSAIAPERNAGCDAVPQILTRNAEHFLWAARSLCDMGYGEVNLNLGCPSGTVTAKGKGSGMLCDLPALERFLSDTIAQSPIPISIKTRIGFASPCEWDALLALFSRYPLRELIVHARTRSEFYAGTPHRDVFAASFARTTLPLVYNGDLFTASDCRTLLEACPGTHALMIGRGLIANPALAQSLTGGEPLTRQALRAFHDRLLGEYLALYPAHVTLGRMREVMKHAVCCFEAPEKPRKAIRKATTLRTYTEAIDRLFDEHALRAEPCFLPGA